MEVRGGILECTSSIYITYDTFKGDSGLESCGITWKSEEEFLKFGTSIIYITYETFKGGSGIESCGITWKSEEEFLKFGTSTILYNL